MIMNRKGADIKKEVGLGEHRYLYDAFLPKKIVGQIWKK